MVQKYSINTVNVIQRILKEMNKNDLVEKLSKNVSEPEVMLLDPSLEDRVIQTTAKESTDTENKLDRSFPSCLDQTTLEWQTFDGSLPKGAVSIYNEYVGRTDYVCKYRSIAGFYNPDVGPHCRYPYATKEHLGSPFEILVNKDNFEFLEWKDGSYGSVPDNAVKTVSHRKIFVGKNKYGLGKVVVEKKSFYLPWKGSEYWYRTYEVLTVNKDIISEQVFDVKYKTDGVKIFKYPPETMKKTTLINKDRQEVKQTATLSKTNEEEQRWDTSFSFTVGAQTSIKARIPFLASSKIEIRVEKNLQFTKVATYKESENYTVSVEHKIPPKHSCVVSMVGYKYGADIPYTARLSRTYRNGETKWTSISGTYKCVQVMEVQAVVDPCEPLPNA
ncbi:natterin-3-like [Anoplopoma fimbria]|uniref:natterin-3-like n=1 Tax=Anoplopoma fimbria TaxID=229290 RepID=UPI0023ECD50B|nr:natterin-3-like [Anoplopoma fimbria]